MKQTLGDKLRELENGTLRELTANQYYGIIEQFRQACLNVPGYQIINGEAWQRFQEWEENFRQRFAGRIQ